jgi:hypothetical protein
MIEKILMPRPRRIDLIVKQSIDEAVSRLKSIFTPSSRFIGFAESSGFRIVVHRPMTLTLFNPKYRGRFLAEGATLRITGSFDFALVEKYLFFGVLGFFAVQTVFGAPKAFTIDVSHLEMINSRIIPFVLLIAARAGLQVRWWMRQWDADAIERRLQSLFRDKTSNVVRDQGG